MRKFLLLLPLILAGCNSDGEDPGIQQQFVQDPAQVVNPVLPPDNPAPVPDESSDDDDSGIQQTVDPVLPPDKPLLAAGDVGEWTARLTGLPFVLNDVVWDGESFIVVGDKGAILTSADGEVWAQQASGTDADLNAIAVDGSDIVAVGDDAMVLVSTDHGASWTIRYSGGDVRLSAVVINPWQIIAGGIGPFMMRSVDLGESWVINESLPQTGHYVTDLAYANGLYLATTDISASMFDTLLLVSIDGEDWQEVTPLKDSVAFFTVLHDGTQFIAAGDWGRVISSPDGYIWTTLQTPFEELSYLSSVWTGSGLMVAGGITWWYWWVGTPPFERATGLSSTDSGATWQTVDIGGYYQSLGMAWGNGHFVSVGQALPNWGEGAIYTSP